MVLHIKVLEVILNIAFDIGGEMDPYFIIEHKKLKYRTKTIKNGGRFAKCQRGQKGILQHVPLRE